MPGSPMPCPNENESADRSASCASSCRIAPCQANIFDALRQKVAFVADLRAWDARAEHTFARVPQQNGPTELVPKVMSIANPGTDWSLLSPLLRQAHRDGWDFSLRNGAVLVVPRRPARGVVLLPARLLGLARDGGWRVSSRPEGFELRHPAVRHRVEVKLAAA